VTESLRPPKETAEPGSVGWFVAKNAAWGALLGAAISVAWLVIIQDFFFAIHIALVGAALSASYGAVSSVPTFLVGRRVAHRRLLILGLVFAGTAMAIQLALVMLVRATPGLLWQAAAYAVLGGVAAALTYRNGLAQQMRTGPTAGGADAHLTRDLRQPRARPPRVQPTAAR
jgi:MFS family permease